MTCRLAPGDSVGSCHICILLLHLTNRIKTEMKGLSFNVGYSHRYLSVPSAAAAASRRRKARWLVPLPAATCRQVAGSCSRVQTAAAALWRSCCLTAATTSRMLVVAVQDHWPWRSFEALGEVMRAFDVGVRCYRLYKDSPADSMSSMLYMSAT